MRRFFKRISKIFTRSVQNSLSYQEIVEMMKKSSNVKLIDVRSIQEYDEGHLNGAINIPLYELQSRMNNIVKDKNTIIIVYCKSGGRSLKAKKVLDALGYINVYNMEDGIDGVNL